MTKSKSLPFRLAAGEKAITGRKFGKLALPEEVVASSDSSLVDGDVVKSTEPLRSTTSTRLTPFDLQKKYMNQPFTKIYQCRWKLTVQAVQYSIYTYKII